MGSDELAQAEQLIGSDPHRAIELAEPYTRASDDDAAIRAARAAAMAARHIPDLDQSTQYFQLALDRCDPDSYDAARIRLSLAGNHAMSGDFTSAHRLLDQLEQSEALGPDRYLVAIQRASAFTIQDRQPEAVVEFERLLNDFDLEPPLKAHVWLNQGSCLVQLGRLDEGRRVLTMARDFYESADDPRSVVDAICNLVMCEAMAGDAPAALSLSEESRKIAEACAIDDGITRLGQAKAFLGAGLGREAEDLVAAAIERVEFNGNVGWLSDAYMTDALVQLLLERPSQALEAAKRALAEARRQEREVGVAKAKRIALIAEALLPTFADFGQAQDAADELAQHGFDDEAQELRVKVGIAALKAGATEEAEVLATGAVQWQGELPASYVNRQTALAIMALCRQSTETAFAELMPAVEAINTHRLSLAATELRARSTSIVRHVEEVAMTAAFATDDAITVWQWSERLRALTLDNRPDVLSRSSDIGEALAQLRVAAQRTRAGEGSGPVVAAQRRVSNLLREAHGSQQNDASTHETPPPDSTTFVEHRGRLHRVECDEQGRAELISDVATVDDVVAALAAIRSDWRRWLRQSSGSNAVAVQLALDDRLRELDDLLGLPRGRRSRTIIVSQHLHGVPWSALGSLQGRTISVGPSATAVLSRQDPQPIVEPEIVLAAGPDLAYSDSELNKLAAIWPQAAVFGSQQSSVEDVLSAMSASRVVHVAAHGTFRADASMFSSLELSDGPLTVLDLERVDVAPQVAVLSACDAGMAEALPGNETLGLISSLLGIGCQSVIAPVLPVADEDCETVMGHLHQGLAQGLSPARALREASARFEPSSSQARLAASFVCFGRG